MSDSIPARDDGANGGLSFPGSPEPEYPILVCTPKQLLPEDSVAAADTAVGINPANRPQLERLISFFPDFVPAPEHLAVVTTKYWGNKGVRLSVQFLDNPPADLRARILLHANEWGKYCNVGFVETAGQGQVRLARSGGNNGGYWSYLGTDILGIPANRATMNLEGFTMNTPEREFIRVVRHEVGHTLGFPHEHMRKELIALLDREKTISYFSQTQGWSAQEVVQQVLTPLSEGSLIGTEVSDASSIMCYQIPGVCTKSGKPIAGGSDIGEMDKAFVAKIYPLLVVPPPPKPTGISYEFYVRVYDPAGKLVAEYGWDKDVKVPGGSV